VHALQKIAAWRRGILEKHTLKAVIQLPAITFAPLAKTDTHITVIEKGRTQSGTATVFHRLGDAGLQLSKGKIRSTTETSNADAIAGAVAVFDNPVLSVTSGAQQSAAVVIGNDAEEWTTGCHLPWLSFPEYDILESVDSLVLCWVGAHTQRVREIVKQQTRIGNGTLVPLEVSRFATDTKYNDAVSFRDKQVSSTVGDVYLAIMGPTKQLGELKAGSDLLLSGTKFLNGMYEDTFDLSAEKMLVRFSCRAFLLALDCPSLSTLPML
jgi:hypothetical protein